MTSLPPFSKLSDVSQAVTAIEATEKFPESLSRVRSKYMSDIDRFGALVDSSDSSAELLAQIRNKGIPAERRMTWLKLFRRVVSPVLDTETSKKINAHSTSSLVARLGHTFKPITKLKKQFLEMSDGEKLALAVLLGENDSRGQVGYMLTETFFDWFEDSLGDEYSIEGPRGAGRDIELSTVYPGYVGSYPCDFVLRELATCDVVAVGFARYDSTRGGPQSDDRTGGNANKVEKAEAFSLKSGNVFKIIFLADGPGLLHGDTLDEARALDGRWNGNVRVTTLRLAPEVITPSWLSS